MRYCIISMIALSCYSIHSMEIIGADGYKSYYLFCQIYTGDSWKWRLDHTCLERENSMDVSNECVKYCLQLKRLCQSRIKSSIILTQHADGCSFGWMGDASIRIESIEGLKKKIESAANKDELMKSCIRFEQKPCIRKQYYSEVSVKELFDYLDRFYDAPHYKKVMKEQENSIYKLKVVNYLTIFLLLCVGVLKIYY